MFGDCFHHGLTDGFLPFFFSPLPCTFLSNSSPLLPLLSLSSHSFSFLSLLSLKKMVSAWEKAFQFLKNKPASISNTEWAGPSNWPQNPPHPLPHCYQSCLQWEGRLLVVKKKNKRQMTISCFFPLNSGTACEVQFYLLSSVSKFRLTSMVGRQWSKVKVFYISSNKERKERFQ